MMTCGTCKWFNQGLKGAVSAGAISAGAIFGMCNWPMPEDKQRWPLTVIPARKQPCTWSDTSGCQCWENGKDACPTCGRPDTQPSCTCYYGLKRREAGAL